MRIVYVTDSLATGGGVEAGLVSLVRELTRRGHETAVVSSGGPLASAVEEAGGRHVRAAIRIRDPLGLLRSGLLLHALVSRMRPHIVHTQSPAGNVAASLLVRRLHRRTHFVTSPLGIQSSEHEARWRVRLRTRLHALRCERVISISPSIRAALLSSGVASRLLVDGVAPWIEPSKFQADPVGAQRVRDELGLPPTTALVTSIGALHSRMSHELFIDAAHQVVATRRDVVFAIAGEGPMRSQLERYAADLGLGTRLRLLGHRSDVALVLGASAVYFKPGVVEGGISTTVVEAQAAGVPVVAFDTLDVREAIQDGKTGLLVPLGDTTALASAIVRMMDDPDLRSGVTEAAREVVERYSVTAAVNRLLAIYELVSGEARGTHG